VLSTGVWISMRPAAQPFGTPIRLADPRPDRRAYVDLAEPRLAMSRSGHAVVAWSDRDGVSAARRSPGGQFGPARRVVAGGVSFRPAPGGQFSTGLDTRALKRIRALPAAA
jgi:hypothetical protein